MFFVFVEKLYSFEQIFAFSQQPPNHIVLLHLKIDGSSCTGSQRPMGCKIRPTFLGLTPSSRIVAANEEIYFSEFQIVASYQLI